MNKESAEQNCIKLPKSLFNGFFGSVIVAKQISKFLGVDDYFRLPLPLLYCLKHILSRFAIFFPFILLPSS
jgi:hypothetical protein